ncbi:MAG: pentapeptide repeat-containing protein [Pseudomonadota bacterium]
MTRDGTTLLIDLIFLVIATVAAFLILVFLARHRPLQPLRDWLAPIPVPDRVKLGGFFIWCMLFAFLLFGVFSSVYNVLKMLPDVNDASDDTPFRASLLTITAMTATLGALIALPFTLVRTLTTERQTRTQEEGYVTQQINEAVANLAAEKTVTRLGRSFSYTLGGKSTKSFEWQGEAPTLPEGAIRTKNEADWKPAERTVANIEVRVGGLLALERLARQRAQAAVEDRASALKAEKTLIAEYEKTPLTLNILRFPSAERASSDSLKGPNRRSSDTVLDHDGARDHVRIMEILCTYIRENAKAADAPQHGLSPWPEYPEKPSADDLKRREKDLAERSKALRAWVNGLPLPRTDIQTALRVLGRRTPDQRACEGFTTRRTQARRGQTISENAWRGYRLDLRDTNLQSADLSHTDDTPLLLSHTRFDGARMEGAILTGARMEGADLTRARIEGTDLSFARLELADFSKAKLEGAVFAQVQAEEARFREAILDEVTFAGANVARANFQNCRMQRAEFFHTQVTDVIFEDADLRDANLGPSDFSHALFSGTLLKGANFQDQRLEDLARALTQEEIEDLFPFGPRIDPSAFHGTAFQNCEIHADMFEPDLLKDCFGDASVCFTGDWPDGYTKIDSNGVQRADTSRNLTQWSADLLTEHRFRVSWREWQKNKGITLDQN